MQRTAPKLFALSLLLSTCCGLPALAQQHPVSQHSPAQKNYTEVTPAQEAKQRAEDAAASKVTLTWLKFPAASRYILKIARDPGMGSVFFTVETVQTAYVTPEFAPGAYYYTVDAFDDRTSVGHHDAKSFVVGSPFKVTGARPRLPAPAIIGPKHLDLFPTYGYVRLAWEDIEGARGYRFRIWNEDKVTENQRWKRDTPPRWITEVKTPWIEVHDAPYTSYMYLESGLYRWDVAAIDKDGGLVGDVAMGFFETSRQWFFKPKEFYGRLQYGFNPHTLYHQNSSITGTNFNLDSSAHRFQGEIEWWMIRQWGLWLDGGFRSFNVNTTSQGTAPFDTILYSDIDIGLLFRTYLSTVPWGWWFVFNAGFGMQEFPQVDQIGATPEAIHVSRPKALGANLGFRLHKRWNSPWEAQLQFRTLIHAFTTTTPTGGAVTTAPFDGTLNLRGLYHWTNHFATWAGLALESRRNMYIPEGKGSNSDVRFLNWGFTLGFQFDYYPAPDNSSYYPESGKSGYYPPEKHPNYYRSEYRNTEDHPRDSSSWQRWRPR